MELFSEEAKYIELGDLGEIVKKNKNVVVLNMELSINKKGDSNAETEK